MAGRSRVGGTFATRTNGKFLDSSNENKKEKYNIKIPSNDRKSKEPLLDISENRPIYGLNDRRREGTFSTVKVENDNLINIVKTGKDTTSVVGKKENIKKQIEEEEERKVDDEDNDTGFVPKPKKTSLKRKSETVVVYGMFFHENTWYYISRGKVYY